MARWDMGADHASMAEAKPTAQDLFDLGIVCASGGITPVDLVAAHKWFNLAALSGIREAADYRREVAQEMSADLIAEAQRAAREWLTTH
jgi:TPR repeat protein